MTLKLWLSPEADSYLLSLARGFHVVSNKVPTWSSLDQGHIQGLFLKDQDKDQDLKGKDQDKDKDFSSKDQE